MARSESHPLVSIIIPVFNGSDYLAEAIDSALAQTYENFEVLVVNDGSTDDGKTRAVALSYGDKIRYFEKENGGVATALNFGIREMRGEYFSWLSHDDLYTPDKLKVQVEAVSRFAEPVIVYSNISAFEGNASAVRRKILPQAEESMQCFLVFDVTTGLNGCSLLIPRVLFEKHGVFDPTQRYTQDYDLWFRLAEHVAFVGVKENLVLSRSHPGQDSKSKSAECAKMADDLHSSLIRRIPQEQLRRFVRGNRDYVLNSYRAYRDCQYTKTAARVLSAILDNSDPSESNRLRAKFVDDCLQWPGQDLASILPNAEARGKPRKKRILIYSNVFIVGGIERVLSCLAGELNDDYDVYLVSGEHDLTCFFPLPDGTKHLKIFNGDYSTLAERLTLLSVALDVDLFIGCPNLCERFLDVYPALHKIGIKAVAWNHYHYFSPMEFDWASPVVCKRNEIYKSVSAAVWLTSLSAGIYAGINSNGVLMPNPNAIAEDPDLEDAGNRTEKIVLCVGRFYDPIKRIDLMLEAFRRVLDLVPDANLYLVGKFDLNARVPLDSKYTIREDLARLGLDESHIVFVGETDRVCDYYRKASVLMMTSDSEGFPMVLNEAAHMGVPAVLFDIPGLEDIVTHGKNGYFVPRYDFDDMAKKIAAVLCDNELRMELAKNAQEMSRQFSQKIVGRRWKDLIETILACDDQAELNRLLSEKFAPKIEDRIAFFRQVVRSYEQHAIEYAKSLQRTTVALEISRAEMHNETIVPLPMLTTRIRTRLRKYRVARFAFHRIFNPMLKMGIRVADWSFRLAASLKHVGVRKTGVKICRKFRSKLTPRIPDHPAIPRVDDDQKLKAA